MTVNLGLLMGVYERVLGGSKEEKKYNLGNFFSFFFRAHR